MDLNQLLYHHQMALIAANRAHRDGRPHANFDLPRYYAKRIGEYRARRGLGVGPALMADRDGGPRADPPTSAQGDDYPVFLGDTLVAELLVNKALAMTEAERAACALGGIAERLTDLHEELWVIGHDIYQALDLDEEKLAKLAADLPPPPPPPTNGRPCICGLSARSRTRASSIAMLTSSAWEAFAIPISRMPAPRCVVSARALRIPGGKPMMPDRKEMPAARARTNPFRRRRPFAPLPPQEAKRQGAISALAFQLLGGRDPALTFLNGESAELRGRPIAISTLSDTGYALVEREIRSRAAETGERHVR